MKYYFAKNLKNIPFEAAIEQVTEALKEGEFGILTEIDVRATMKKKLDEDFRPYKILGACNPPLAFKALQAEDKIGTMLPCNVIVQQTDTGVEVAAVSPKASMAAVDNAKWDGIANEIEGLLKKVIVSL